MVGSLIDGFSSADDLMIGDDVGDLMICSGIGRIGGRRKLRRHSGWKMNLLLHSSFAAASLACTCSGVPAAIYVK